MLSVRNIIRIKKLEESAVELEEKWSEAQQADIEKVFQMIEDLIASAVASGSSPHAYVQLQEKKAEFLEEYVNTQARYRKICEKI